MNRSSLSNSARKGLREKACHHGGRGGGRSASGWLSCRPRRRRVPQPQPSASLSWSACTDEGLEGLQCASLQVPLDHSKPNGPKITLALSQFQHTGTTGYQGSLLVNPGGPGGTGP